MEDFIVTQAISVLLFMMQDKKKSEKFMPAILKVRDAALVLAPLDAPTPAAKKKPKK